MKSDSTGAIGPLVENACHFLRSTLGEIRRESTGGNRNAVIFIAAALEVLLKTRLALEHWTLLFDDPGKAQISELKSGDFVSAQASKLVTRLNNVASLGLGGSSADKVFRLRNRVVHYAPPSDLAVRVEVALGLNFALEFIHNHLLPDIHDPHHDDLSLVKEEIAEVFLELDAYREKRLLLLSGELSVYRTIVECPDCHQETLAVDDEDTLTCRFCLVEDESASLAQRYVEEVMSWGWRDEADGGDKPLHECFSCGVFSLVVGVRVRKRPQISYVCFSCADVFEGHEVRHCGRCGELMAVGDDAICPNCWSGLVRYDD